jgi:hypothetical protein
MKKYHFTGFLLLPMVYFFCFELTAQNVGIGTNTPTGPLSFASTTGNKIVLWGSGNESHYGIGIQGGTFQIYANQLSDAIAFGTGSSANFTERARIYRSFDGLEGMTVRGRLHLLNGNPANAGGGGGVWLYKPDNLSLLGFMGTQNDKNIGFFGGPNQWGFTYDVSNSRVGIGNNNPNAPLAFGPTLGKKITLYPGNLGDAGLGMAGNRLQIYSDNPNADVAIGYDAAGVFNERFAVKPNGALAVVGNTGQPGQVLVSNGPNAAATWSAGSGGAMFVAAQTQNSETVNPGNVRDIPGLVANFTITSPSRVVFQYRARINNTSCFACGEKRGFVALYQNITGGTQTVVAVPVYMPNGDFNDAVSGPIPVDLQPGTYSYKVVLEASAFGSQPMIAWSSGFGRLTWQIFPL